VRRRWTRACCLALLWLGGADSALALTCSVSAIATSFGTYNPFSAVPLDSAGSVTVTCEQLLISILVSYSIQLSSGASGGYAPRRLAGPGYQLDYNLYTNAARSSVWGDGGGGTAVVSDGYLLGIVVPVQRSYTVYGRMPAGQNVAPGSYTDTITVTINY
jgi:spore coat protein U-like protein